MHCMQSTEGQCSCYLNPQNKIQLIYGENHNVFVFKGDEKLGYKQISIIDGSK